MLGSAAHLIAADPPDAQVKEKRLGRGKLLYLQSCVVCHQNQGQGTPGSFPPLAKSDFLLKERERVIKGLCEGLNGPITVNGASYNGFMPPAVLNDQQVADVLTFVLTSLGNDGGPVDPEEVASIRKKTQFKTYEALRQANEFQPLAKTPVGWKLREVARLPNHATRLASDGKGKTLYALCGNGDVWRTDVASGATRQILWGSRYLDAKLGEPPPYLSNKS